MEAIGDDVGRGITAADESKHAPDTTEGRESRHIVEDRMIYSVFSKNTYFSTQPEKRRTSDKRGDEKTPMGGMSDTTPGGFMGETGTKESNTVQTGGDSPIADENSLAVPGQGGKSISSQGNSKGATSEKQGHTLSTTSQT